MTTELAAIERSPLLDANIFTQMTKLAEVMSTDLCLPAHLKGNMGGCLRIVEVSYRVGQSPYAIADSTYFVGGRLAMDGKLIAALINSHPSIDGSLHYKYEGDIKKPDEFFVVVSARKVKEVEDRTIKVSLRQGLQDSKGAQKRWESDPEQMLAYYGGRVWARRHAPEVIMGLYAPEELKAAFDNAKDITPKFDDKNDLNDKFNKILASVVEAQTIKELTNIVPEIQNFHCSILDKNHLREAYKERLDQLKVIEVNETIIEENHNEQ